MYLQQGCNEEVIVVFQCVVEIVFEFLLVLLYLGNFFEVVGDKMQVLYYQCCVYVLLLMEGKFWEMVGIFFYFFGCLDEVVEVYCVWLVSEFDNLIVVYMLVVCLQLDVFMCVLDCYFELYFDCYVEMFEINLLYSFGYCGFSLIGQGVGLVMQVVCQFVIIDIGCGIGLCGICLWLYLQYLIGVDLVGKMLEKVVVIGYYD